MRYSRTISLGILTGLAVAILVIPPLLMDDEEPQDGSWIGADTPSAQPIGYWSFDQTLAGTPGLFQVLPPGEPPEYIPGREREAVRFPLGSGGRFAHGLVLPESVPMDNISISFWLKPGLWDPEDAPAVIVAYVLDAPSTGDSPSVGLGGAREGGQLVFVERLQNTSGGPSLLQAIGEPRFPDQDRWHFVTLRISQEKETAIVTVDNELDITATVQGNWSGDGRLFLGSGTFNGGIDELRIFNGILTQEEIEKLYTGQYATDR